MFYVVDLQIMLFQVLSFKKIQHQYDKREQKELDFITHDLFG